MMKRIFLPVLGIVVVAAAVCLVSSNFEAAQSPADEHVKLETRSNSPGWAGWTTCASSKDSRDTATAP